MGIAVSTSIFRFEVLYVQAHLSFIKPEGIDQRNAQCANVGAHIDKGQAFRSYRYFHG